MWRQKKAAVIEELFVQDEHSPRKNKKKVRMFRITFVDRDGNIFISVNGIVGGKLKLRNGYTYYFNIKSNPSLPDVHFYLTTNPNGGPDDMSEPVAGTVPIASGAFTLDINDSLPSKFYYQLKEIHDAGGICAVEESE